MWSQETRPPRLFRVPTKPRCRWAVRLLRTVLYMKNERFSFVYCINHSHLLINSLDVPFM